MTKLDEYIKQHVDLNGPLPGPEQVEAWPEIAGVPCYVWTGETRKGYGRIYMEGTEWHGASPHRAVYAQANGSPPKALMVCHKCDNRSCCNLIHLFLDTGSGNMKDCVAKGRHFTPGWTHHPTGEDHHRTVLRAEQVWEIWCLVWMGGLPVREAADLYGVERRVVSKVKNGATWTHVTVPTVGAERDDTNRGQA